MFKKAIHFIKYNNLVVLIIAVIFLLGSGALAQTEAGQTLIGKKQISESGTDNSLLLEADLDNLDMDYTIEKIEEDDDYYYAVYTYIDLIKQNNAWIYLMQEDVRKTSKKLKQDLGEYLAEELSEERDARLKILRAEQAKASETGEEKRVEVTEYSGLIGQTLELAGRIFPGYEPVKQRKLPSPTVSPNILARPGKQAESGSQSDNLTDIYNQYIEKMDPDRDNFLGALDNCPNVYNPDQTDSDGDGIGDACEQEQENDNDLPDSDNGQSAAAPVEDTADSSDGAAGDQAENQGENEAAPEPDEEDGSQTTPSEEERADAGSETSESDEGGADDANAENQEASGETSGEASTENEGAGSGNEPSEDAGQANESAESDVIVVPDVDVEIVDLDNE